MGLDMYLTRRRYVGAHFEHLKITGAVTLCDDKGNRVVTEEETQQISEIILETAYWRKANAIHKWFVDNCQEGVDECQESYVSREQLEKLYELCQEVLKDPDKAAELLPVQGGFFFGGTEYDSWYFEKLQYTVDTLKPIVEEKTTPGDGSAQPGYDDFYYHASW